MAERIDPAHGTRARYCAGCRCRPCTERNTVYQRGYRAGLRGESLRDYGDRAIRRRTSGGVTWSEPAMF